MILMITVVSEVDWVITGNKNIIISSWRIVKVFTLWSGNIYLHM